MTTSRRDFLKGLACLGALGAAGCAASKCGFNIGRAIRRGGKVRLAVVGIWGKGYEDMKWFLKHGKVEIAAL